jgi:hypothetical protein
MEEERTEITGEEKEKVLLMLHGDVLLQLLQHSRFQYFIAANYEIKPKIDHEGHSIGFTVREFPLEEIQKLMAEAAKAAQNSIVTASMADLEKLPKM